MFMLQNMVKMMPVLDSADQKSGVYLVG